MENIKIIIEIRGGTLAAVYANAPVEYVLVDFDNLQSEEVITLDTMQPTLLNPTCIPFTG